MFGGSWITIVNISFSIFLFNYKTWYVGLLPVLQLLDFDYRVMIIKTNKLGFPFLPWHFSILEQSVLVIFLFLFFTFSFLFNFPHFVWFQSVPVESLRLHREGTYRTVSDQVVKIWEK